MSFKIFSLAKKDLLQINKILIKEIGASETKDISKSLKNGFAKKIVVQNKIIGFCIATEFTNHISLSYYYLDEEYRRKPVSLFFFAYCFSHLSHKPIYVKKNKNFDMYSRYFENTEEEGIIKFTNLRKDYEWVELLKLFQM
ncbi:hypothetical protein [Aliarcobacter cibarius]|uniref:N-acetyltransferase domain-containing protein n=1 Tax=Aliarcobacter cibarius TaxID=255507 RepID=A0ABY2V540_9BACT|nr:hypothetical protein [Aliarcobacter cibarius]TLS99943.1 hypothetical protein FE247_05270 [Aliarcobacter cibarius]TLT00352.1 hypothetical protein FE245_05700 [Aliarcobacter cibarius]